MSQPSKKEHATGVAVVLFVFAAFCFRDVSVSGDDLLVLPGIGFIVAGLYASRRALRLSRR